LKSTGKAREAQLSVGGWGEKKVSFRRSSFCAAP